MNIKSKSYPLVTMDKLRYSDTDRQGHINNALFSTFLETGRVEILYNQKIINQSNETEFVIANLTIQFISEILWPGYIETKTAIKKIGTSSIIFEQVIYQAEKQCAAAETVIVQINKSNRQPSPLTNMDIQELNKYLRES
ncbi:thioesterase [Acinetobacter gyllenbergii]|uniref:Acyl-CoA thioester hydrolase n=1 Tax=Acinetobacter gyllenbergii CIP 110306 = MTCC 11365 TaxID=1217657 RepID=A0A829HLG2_9GAMM|nr:thioesterase family protein [Acinetobacter gyllenbergii]EPF91830.1 acyl-CoA thioester hydrolase [Acinetobacter gyllenbergii CIP 110306 = MTCC 11365]OBY73231.1 thioesterase [Acinetobacter gyllenbergii]GMA10714.1 thioesterase [Acinetobacter gyllenbergii]